MRLYKSFKSGSVSDIGIFSLVTYHFVQQLVARRITLCRERGY
jgi:hypothetical protein